MKKHITLAAILLLFFTCKNDQESPIIEGSLLTIDELKDYLPKQYQQKSDVVYINASGEEKRLGINYIEEVVERTYTDKSMYRTEGLYVVLYDPENINFKIDIVGSANYFNDTPFKALSYTLMPYNSSGTTWTRITFENSVPVVTPNMDIQEVVELNGKQFSDVLITKSDGLPDFYEAYSELDINKEVGVVAFRDKDNQLWVFDRFEE